MMCALYLLIFLIGLDATPIGWVMYIVALFLDLWIYVSR